jgi:hypothetical protein
MNWKLTIRNMKRNGACVNNNNNNEQEILLHRHNLDVPWSELQAKTVHSSLTTAFKRFAVAASFTPNV